MLLSIHGRACPSQFDAFLEKRLGLGRVYFDMMINWVTVGKWNLHPATAFGAGVGQDSLFMEIGKIALELEEKSSLLGMLAFQKMPEGFSLCKRKTEEKKYNNWPG